MAPESERHSWGARTALEVFDRRLGLVTRQLARSPYLAGAKFAAADIAVTYALLLVRRAGGVTLGGTEAYMARTIGRESYKRTMETCQSTRAWAKRCGE
jgi:glutathione S-transferase